jgi:site-specific recombinase XerD
MESHFFTQKKETKSKNKRIKSPKYRKFLNEGIIDIITETDLENALNNIKGKFKTQARALIICLYYTGARPNEVLRLKAKDIIKEKTYILIKIKSSKGGRPRTVYLRYKLKYVKELWKFASQVFMERLLFWRFISQYERTYITKKGEKITRIEYTDKLRYHFKKWFKDKNIPPYYLRHNRFSSLAMNGATLENLRFIKGSSSYNSVLSYLHMSEAEAKKVSKMIK